MKESQGVRVARKSYRYRGYDYAEQGCYVFTVVVHDRRCLLGRIKDKQFVASPAGLIVFDCWTNIPKRFPTILLDAFVVMPNHIHGILLLGANPEIGDVDDQAPSELVASPFMARKPGGNQPVPPSRNAFRPGLGEVVRSLKASSTAEIRKQDQPDFGWQPNYWDRIVRNDRELERFRRYIESNPERWEEDKEYLKADS